MTLQDKIKAHAEAMTKAAKLAQDIVGNPGDGVMLRSIRHDMPGDFLPRDIGTAVKMHKCIFLCINEEEPVRPDAEEVWALTTPTLQIPWPEGLTFTEALLAWRDAYAEAMLQSREQELLSTRVVGYTPATQYLKDLGQWFEDHWMGIDGAPKAYIENPYLIFKDDPKGLADHERYLKEEGLSILGEALSPPFQNIENLPREARMVYRSWGLYLTVPNVLLEDYGPDADVAGAAVKSLCEQAKEHFSFVYERQKLDLRDKFLPLLAVGMPRMYWRKHPTIETFDDALDTFGRDCRGFKLTFRAVIEFDKTDWGVPVGTRFSHLDVQWDPKTRSFVRGIAMRNPT